MKSHFLTALQAATALIVWAILYGAADQIDRAPTATVEVAKQ